MQVFANQLQTGVTKLWIVTTKVNAIYWFQVNQSPRVIVYLSGPEIKVAQRGQFDEVLGTGARHLSEGQTETFEVAQRATIEQQFG